MREVAHLSLTDGNSMVIYDRVSLASKKARDLHRTTGLSYYVVATDDGDWFIVRHPLPDMVVWRSFMAKNK